MLSPCACYDNEEEKKTVKEFPGTENNSGRRAARHAVGKGVLGAALLPAAALLPCCRLPLL